MIEEGKGQTGHFTAMIHEPQGVADGVRLVAVAVKFDIWPCLVFGLR